MVANKVRYRHLMLFFFRKGKNATQAANKICAVYCEDAVAERTVRMWFTRFRTGNFDLEDQERPDYYVVHLGSIFRHANRFSSDHVYVPTNNSKVAFLLDKREL
ncbi:histone-lysine N-methyltransferase SETMAR-like, partial [Ceratina calcarata]|uniref:Histone-lysine N-methyltransferase SETMAR-like n=1 Tax=Ceratina calcarata TaxID=156304 RepID=A0AAJ7WF73_9HYME